MNSEALEFPDWPDDGYDVGMEVTIYTHVVPAAVGTRVRILESASNREISIKRPKDAEQMMISSDFGTPVEYVQHVESLDGRMRAHIPVSWLRP